MSPNNDDERCASAIDWTIARANLDRQGWTILPGLLSPAECRDTAALYEQDAGLRQVRSGHRHTLGLIFHDAA
jgi:hypothetical protein